MNVRSEKKRILYVYQGDWPRNATRVLKQTRALAEDGHAIRLLSANPRAQPPLTTTDWMEVERVPRLGPPRVNRVLSFPIFANPIWIWWIISAARRFRPTAIIVRDLPLAPCVLAVGWLFRVPVHYEMADVYPIALRANRDDHPGFVSRLLRRPGLAEWLDKIVVRRAESVFVVSEESRQRCIDLGAQAERVVIVGNTPAHLSEVDRELPVPDDIADWLGRPVVLFVGNLLADRGLPDAIKAVEIVRRAIPSVALAIVGDGREFEVLRSLIDAKGLNDHVRLLGWKPLDDHAAYYRISTIGVLPFRSTEHIEITLANKLFDYMGAGLAIVASDVRPMRRVLQETGAGVLVPPGDIHALASALSGLLRDPERCRELAIRGRAAVDGPYSWREDRARLIATVTRQSRTA